MTQYLDSTLAKRLYDVKDTEGKSLIETLIGMSDEALGYYMGYRQHGAIPDTIGSQLIRMDHTLKTIKILGTDPQGLDLRTQSSQIIQFLLTKIIEELLSDQQSRRKLLANAGDGLKDSPLSIVRTASASGSDAEKLARTLIEKGIGWDFICILKDRGASSPTLDAVKIDPEQRGAWFIRYTAKRLRDIGDANLSDPSDPLKHKLLPDDVVASDFYKHMFSTGPHDLDLEKISSKLILLSQMLTSLARDPDALLKDAKESARGKMPGDIDRMNLENVLAGITIAKPARMAGQLERMVKMIEWDMKDKNRPNRKSVGLSQ